MPTPPDAILIAGPTASGKSAFALELAERVGGTIINADSMQVYRDLRVLTARPSPKDERQVPHRLYGHLDGATAYSAGAYAKDVAQVLQDVRDEGRVPIIVGGTGLYFKVLLEGLSPVPEIDPQIRAKWRQRGADETAEALHQELTRRDPVMAERLVPSDRQRLVRALEVIDHTGRSLAAWQEAPGEPILTGDNIEKLVIAPPRAELHTRAHHRFAAMMEEGAVDEVRQLLARKLDPNLPVMRALGVSAIAGLLDGRLDRAAAIEQGTIETRQYIKRQSTWLKKHMMSWNWSSAQ